MNWDALAALTSILAFVAILIGGAIGYGQLKQLAQMHGEVLRDHKEKLDDHETRLSHVEGGLRKVTTL